MTKVFCCAKLNPGKAGPWSIFFPRKKWSPQDLALQQNLVGVVDVEKTGVRGTAQVFTTAHAGTPYMCFNWALLSCTATLHCKVYSTVITCLEVLRVKMLLYSLTFGQGKYIQFYRARAQNFWFLQGLGAVETSALIVARRSIENHNGLQTIIMDAPFIDKYRNI